MRLHQGESVEVLDAKRTGPATTTGANTWYKIAPPSGEFRWVSGKFVDAEFARDGVRKTAADGGAVQATGVSATAATAPPSNEPAAGAVLAQPDPSPATPRRVTAEQFQAELNEIDVELSAIVVEEPTVWELGELRQRAQSLMNQAETALERGRARTLVSKIARFEDIKERHNAVAALRDKTERVDRQLAKLGPRPRGAAPATDDSRFDATGYLTRVSKPKPGAPQYALVDQNGKVQSYVTPAPGVNLQSYLGRQVGVTGTRGYMPEQRATHVMARHISAVDADDAAVNHNIPRYPTSGRRNSRAAVALCSDWLALSRMRSSLCRNSRLIACSIGRRTASSRSFERSKLASKTCRLRTTGGLSTTSPPLRCALTSPTTASCTTVR